MVDWLQIGKDYFLFILFSIACVVYIIYRLWNSNRLKKEAESAQRMMHKPSFAPPPAWEPPAQMVPPPPQPTPVPVYENKLREFQDTEDEVPVVEDKPRRGIVEEETDFRDMFEDVMAKPEAPKQTDVMNALASLTEEMKTNSEVLQGTLEDDLATLRKKLDIITTRRTEIKRYGVLLGELYKKYEHREKQLSVMVVGLERLEEMRESGLNPSIGNAG
jgi:hypothetical protein